MAFKVRIVTRVQSSTSKESKEFGDDDIYNFHEGGILSITYADEAKQTEYYPAHRWEQLLADSNHRPGDTGGEHDIRDTVF
jgi:hypothetical protein